MIKIGRLPGKLYQVEFEEGMTVGQAITKARTLAEEQGKSLDVAGCQIRISGNEVNESALLANNSVVTISQKIKGNFEDDGIITVAYNGKEEELMVNDETTAGEILEILGLEGNLEVQTADGESLDNDDELMENGDVFVIGEKTESEKDDDEDYDDEYKEEGEDYENDYDDDDDDEEERTCNCGGNCHRYRDVLPLQVNVKQEAEISNGKTSIKIVVEGEDVEDKIHQLIRKAKELL